MNGARAGSLYLSCPLTNLKIVLTHNRNDSDVKRGNKLVNMKSREVAMKNVQSYRAMGLICRQRAVFDPEHSWKHLGDAEKWEHLAYDEIAANFRKCKIAGSAELDSPVWRSSSLGRRATGDDRGCVALSGERSQCRARRIDVNSKKSPQNAGHFHMPPSR